MRIPLAVAAAAAVASVTVATTSASPPSLTLVPSTVKRGHALLLKGSVDGCPVGDTVLLLSRAFVHVHSFAGVAAVLTRVRAGHVFRVSTVIPVYRRPGRYGVTGRCGGGNLGFLEYLRVRA
jgi:hypothetical protein